MGRLRPRDFGTEMLFKDLAQVRRFHEAARLSAIAAAPFRPSSLLSEGGRIRDEALSSISVSRQARG
jgi:hypothetical protein